MTVSKNLYIVNLILFLVTSFPPKSKLRTSAGFNPDRRDCISGTLEKMHKQINNNEQCGGLHRSMLAVVVVPN